MKDIEVVWHGELPGVLVPGGQTVWHVSRESNATDAPVETIQWVTPPEAHVEMAWVDDDMRRWVMKPANAAMPGGFPKKRYDGESLYQSQCFDAGSQRLYFIDVEQSDPNVLAVDVRSGEIVHIANPDLNNYFDRYLRVASNGALISGSGMGVEILASSHGVTQDLRRKGSTSTAIQGIAASDRHFLIVGFDGRRATLFTHGGVECWGWTGFDWNGQYFEFHYQSEQPFHVMHSWIDREDRLWLSGHDLAVFSKNRECLFACQQFGRMLNGFASFVGVDDRGLAWFETTDGYTAFRIPSLSPQTFAPSLAERGPRTGLEPVLGVVEDDDLGRGLPHYYTS